MQLFYKRDVTEEEVAQNRLLREELRRKCVFEDFRFVNGELVHVCFSVEAATDKAGAASRSVRG